MDYKFARVALEHIDTTNVSYRITTTQDKPSLQPSIGRIGLINPAILKESDDRMIVVSGFRRIRACRRLHWPEIPCRILPPDCSPAQCIEVAITDNFVQRSLNIIEQARCMQLLSTAVDPDSGRQIAATLGIPMNSALSPKLKAVLSAPEDVQSALLTGRIGLPTALLLTEMPHADAAVMVSVFSRLPMGLNKQREVLVLVQEIAARDGVPVQQILEAPLLKGVIEDPQLDGNLKSRHVRSHLKKMRFPRLVEVENAFNQCVAALELGGAIHIAPPSGFEGRTCTMTIRFDTLQDLKRAHRKISETIDHSVLASLFDCL